MDEFSKEEKTLIGPLGKLSYLIIDPATSRTSIRKMLSTYKVKPSQIDVIERYSDALELVKAKKPNVIFADSELEGLSVLNLSELQQSSLDPAAPRCLLMITSKDSKSLASTAASDNVDGVLLKPFTFETLREQFIGAVSKVVAPNPYQKCIMAGKALIAANQPDKAIEIFKKAKTLDPKPALACYFEGFSHQKLGKETEGFEAFAEGLKHEPTHYKCLVGSLEHCLQKGEHAKAYDFGRKIVEAHTLPLQKLPDMVKLSVLNKKYSDILSFYAMVEGGVEVDANVSISLAAGLVVCGLHFVQTDDPTSAVQALKKAELSSKGNPKILKKVLGAMYRTGNETEIRALTLRVPDEVRDAPEILLAELEQAENTKPGAEVFQLASSLMQKGIQDERLYEIAIRRSVELKRKESHIDELIAKAAQHFPQKKELFASLKPPAAS